MDTIQDKATARKSRNSNDAIGHDEPHTHTHTDIHVEGIDEGFHAWLVVAGAWCCLFCGFGWVNAIGIFQDYYEKHQLRDYSPDKIAWILSLEPFVIFAAGLFIGKLFDNYGPRWLLVAGTFLHTFGLLMTSISTEYYQFLLAQGLCSPLGASLVFYPALSCTATWFQKRRALAFGIVSSGSSLGGIVFPTMLARLLPIVGFAWSLRVSGLIVFTMLLVANFTVRSRIRPVPRPLTLGDYVEPFAELPFVLLVFASCAGFFAMFVPINYLIVQAQNDGVDPIMAGYLLTILNAGSLPGRILPGYLGDKLGRFNVMIIMCSLSAVVLLALWLPGTLLAPGSLGVYVAFALLYGFASGAFVGMVPALLGQISVDVTKIGVRQGVLFTWISLASLTGSPIAGAIMGRQQGAYWGLQVFAGGIMVVSALFFIAARVKLVGGALHHVV